jgi:hypothetical protein
MSALLIAYLYKFILALVSDVSLLSSEIYRQKLQQCVTDGELDDDEVSALLRLRVMLCIPQQTVEAAHSDICGSLFEKVTVLSLFGFRCLLLYVISSCQSISISFHRIILLFFIFYFF